MLNSGQKDDEKERERRQKQGRRLQEINAKRREEKVSAPLSWTANLWDDNDDDDDDGDDDDDADYYNTTQV